MKATLELQGTRIAATLPPWGFWMLFTSPVFLFFFLPAFLILYHLTPASLKNVAALIGSAIFFAWGEPIFVFVLLATTYADYRVSLVIRPDSRLSQPWRRRLLIATLCAETSVLLWSKYLNFFLSVLRIHTHGQTSSIPLILGISFITFHKISYLVDSYYGRATPPRSYIDCALYIFLFPQLIAGPIIRYYDLGEQIRHREHTADDFLYGFFRFGIGLAKKALIADPIGRMADAVFQVPAEQLPASYAWMGIAAYTLQIYFDFSGYSDMAIGLARTMGFHFLENFNRPYISRSITEFWQRWHISLSNWMRLYLYIPLGGNRVSPARTYLNLWIVFLISGFWHGASWNFIAWGAYYGLFLSIERALESVPSRIVLPGFVRQAITLLIVMIGWVLFRSPTLSYARHYLAVMFGATPHPSDLLQPWGFVFDNRGTFTMVIAAVIACAVVPEQLLAMIKSPRALFARASEEAGIGRMVAQFSAALVLLGSSVMALLSSGYVPFLYFRF